jgi:dephospho-CoA kinase
MKGSPVIVGLLGGMASGKSTVARLLSGHGAEVVDADRIAHEVLREPEIARRVAGLFGPEVLCPDGTPDRARLGEVVFGDPEGLERLEALIHPEVRRRISGELSRLGGARLIVLDAPLLLEGGLEGLVDVLVFVQAPADARRARSAARHGFSTREHDDRERLQMALQEKMRRAAMVIRNDGSLADLEDRVEQLLSDLLDPGKTKKG